MSKFVDFKIKSQINTERVNSGAFRKVNNQSQIVLPKLKLKQINMENGKEFNAY